MEHELTEFDRELLHGLNRPGYKGDRTQGGWFTPLDLGGRSRSKHSPRLKALTKKGLVECRVRGSRRPPGRGQRTGCEYKITEAGIAALSPTLETGGGDEL